MSKLSLNINFKGYVEMRFLLAVLCYLIFTTSLFSQEKHSLHYFYSNDKDDRAVVKITEDKSKIKSMLVLDAMDMTPLFIYEKDSVMIYSWFASPKGNAKSGLMSNGRYEVKLNDLKVKYMPAKFPEIEVDFVNELNRDYLGEMTLSLPDVSKLIKSNNMNTQKIFDDIKLFTYKNNEQIHKYFMRNGIVLSHGVFDSQKDRLLSLYYRSKVHEKHGSEIRKLITWRDEKNIPYKAKVSDELEITLGLRGFLRSGEKDFERIRDKFNIKDSYKSVYTFAMLNSIIMKNYASNMFQLDETVTDRKYRDQALVAVEYDNHFRDFVAGSNFTFKDIGAALDYKENEEKSFSVIQELSKSKHDNTFIAKLLYKEGLKYTNKDRRNYCIEMIAKHGDHRDIPSIASYLFSEDEDMQKQLLNF